MVVKINLYYIYFVQKFEIMFYSVIKVKGKMFKRIY